jgi:Uma2 family endonuclease
MWSEIRLETDELYEIWGGEKIMMSPSSSRHESVISKLNLFIANFVFERKLGAVFSSNTAVYLHGDPRNRDFLMPDLTFVSAANKAIVRDSGLYGAPDLVAEVISPGLANTRRDMIDKYNKYETAGVKEYWLVDPYECRVEIYALHAGKYEKIEESEVLQGIELDEQMLFGEDFEV